MFCRQCGKELETGSKFCDGCGTPVVEDIATPVSQEVEAPTPRAEIPREKEEGKTQSGKTRGRKKIIAAITGGTVLVVVLLNVVIPFFSSEVLPEWDEYGYDIHPVVSGKTTFETTGSVKLDSDKTSLGLDDQTGFTLPNMTDGDSYTLTLERATNTVSLEGLDLETTGSMRVVRLDGVEFSGNEADLYGLTSKVTIPGAEKGDIDIDTINVARIGDVIEGGEVVTDTIKYLPATLDEDGNIVATDIYMHDSVLIYYLNQSVTQGVKAPDPTLEKELSYLLFGKDSFALAADLDAGQNEPVEIRYTLITFQNSMNWNRQPHLVRMVPDIEVDNKRTPIDQVTAKEREEELKKPVQNVIVFVHGRNEAEKEGAALNDISAPWFYSYKRDAWTHMYEVFADNYEDRLGCTVFYEFIYPTFRPIVTPVDGEGNRTTLDTDFNRRLEFALKEQLGNDLDFNLIIVAHSMGGLVSRAGVQHFSEKMDANFRNLITWGTPHHGSPLVTVRYALGATGTVYNMEHMPGMNWASQHVIYYQLRQMMQEFTIDTPGTRDLRWDGGPVDLPIELNLGALFTERFDPGESLVADMYNLDNGDYLYSRNLKTLNSSDRYRTANKYIFMYGITTKTAVSGLKTVRIPGTGREIAIPVPETDFGEIALGATMMSHLLKEPDTFYQGYPMDSSDGAVPIPSMAGGTLSGVRVNVGDIDHEEYFGAPTSSAGYPNAFTGAGAAKATYMANETYRVMGMGIVEDYNCPEMILVDPPEDGTIGIKAAGAGEDTIDLSKAEDTEIIARLEWPGDSKPGLRIKEVKGIEIRVSDKLVEIEEIEIEEDGSFTLTVMPEKLLGQKTIQDSDELEIDLQITLIFKDDTQFESEELAITVSIEKAGLSIDPSIVSSEPGALVDFTLTVENYDGPVSFEWDFGDGSTLIHTDTGAAEHVFDDDKEKYIVTVRMYERGNTNTTLATAGATVYVGGEDEEEDRNLVDLLQSFGLLNVGLYTTDIHRTWSKTHGEGTDTSTWGVKIPWPVAGGGPMDITWDGPYFTGTRILGDPDRNGSIHEVNGKVSADGTVVESIVFSYRYRDEGTDTVRNAYANLEFADIPLTWNPGREDRQAELIYRAYDADVAKSHVVLIEHDYETLRNGELESSRTYVSTDWSEGARFIFTLKKY